MRTGSRSIVAALLAVVSFAATACSSSHHAPPFDSSYRNAAADYRTQLGHLQQHASSLIGQSPTAQLALFDDLSNATTRAHKALAELDPPAAVASPYRQLVSLLAKQQVTLGRIETGVRANDRNALNSALSTYATDLQSGVSLFHQIDQSLHLPSPTS